jgi:hypothetical protein
LAYYGITLVEKVKNSAKEVKEAVAIYDKVARRGYSQNAQRALGLAIWVLETPGQASEFLETKHPLLNDKTPLEACESPSGFEAVERILFNIEYSIPA